MSTVQPQAIQEETQQNAKFDEQSLATVDDDDCLSLAGDDEPTKHDQPSVLKKTINVLGYTFETHGFYMLHCNVCLKDHKSLSDASQVLPCKHVYIEKPFSKDKKKFTNKYNEMCFRMKALQQGNNDVLNKKLIDDYYERNELFAAKYSMYGRFQGNATWNFNNLQAKTMEDVAPKSKWGIVRKNVKKSKTWMSRISRGYVKLGSVYLKP